MKLTIGSGVREIKNKAFANAGNITEIYSLAVVPPICSSENVFDQYVYRAATVYVPNERNAVGRYKADDVWNNFFEIIAEEVDAVNTISLTDNPSSRIYNLSGNKFQTPQPGINIINGKKVLIK